MAERRDEIIEACKRLHVSRLDVFGSAANETFDPGRSDVDFKPGVSLTLCSDLKKAFERILGRDIDLVERRQRSMWRDDALLLDIVIAASDARAFVADLDWCGFSQSRLHQNAVIRSLEIIGEAANNLSPSCKTAHPICRGAIWSI